MNSESKELAGVSTATAISLGLRAASFMVEKIDLSATVKARESSEANLIKMMDPDGPIGMDGDLAIRAFQALSAHEIQLMESKRKLIETYISLSEKLMPPSQDNSVLRPDETPSADPMAEMGNSAFAGL
jgi:hypothetical protein